jgi:hypothetical protein
MPASGLDLSGVRIAMACICETTMKSKRIEYAYASSPSAVRFGFGKRGCYTVEIVDGIKPPQVICGYNTLVEARAAAERLSEPWDKLTK